MFYSFITKFIDIFFDFTPPPNHEVSEKFRNQDDLPREPTRDFYEDLGKPH
jgi:hypothetical protein